MLLTLENMNYRNLQVFQIVFQAFDPNFTLYIVLYANMFKFNLSSWMEMSSYFVTNLHFCRWTQEKDLKKQD